MDRIGFFLRFAAYLIDLFLGTALFFLGCLAGLLLLGNPPALIINYHGNTDTVPIQAVLTGFTLMWLVVHFPEMAIGASPGKILLGLRIRHDSGSPAYFPTLFKRYCLKNLYYVVSIVGLCLVPFFQSMFSPILIIFMGIALLVSFVFVLGYLLPLLPGRQALHDLITETAVYSLRQCRHAESQAEERRPSIIPVRQTGADPNALLKTRW
jgi:uncharacterized RDD family membrane protein YckC